MDFDNLDVQMILSCGKPTRCREISWNAARMRQNAEAIMRRALETHASRIRHASKLRGSQRLRLRPRLSIEAEISQCIEEAIHWWITDPVTQGAQGASALDKKLGAEISLAPEFSVFSISSWIAIN